ncbi:MAG: malto-oligosyltrehalose trehalohydrolase [Verrucomicrobia bacterium]|nr:MAG: malto-oligosyltrehalose trehalohydrolase [Verrucomicrobiota bacterium]
MNLPNQRLGATVGPEGVTYHLWAPSAQEVVTRVYSSAGNAARVIPLKRDSEGYHTGRDPQGRPGDRYMYLLDDRGPYPDPASRAQHTTPHGPCIVIDPKAYDWHDASWKRPPFRDLVLYELHIGAFGGTYRGCIEHLDFLRDLGVNALEIMPIADFPGSWNWGYDGVLIYAPARCYGTPDDFRALIDAAHTRGLAVILDVVYNHLGPDGNHLERFSTDYFHPTHETPWGKGFQFRLPAVRRLFVENLLYWMEDFHMDGFRLDATQEIMDESSPHVLAEMTTLVKSRGGYIIAEDMRNEAKLISSTSEGGKGFDGVWTEDFHHAIRVGQTGENSLYYGDFNGSIDELISTLIHGWYYRGEHSKFWQRYRGTESRHLPPQAFVYYLSNHDQTGNRPLGDRLHELISPAAYRAMSMFFCLLPYTPMLFMGQEWAASTPFLYFTDHETDLGRAITEGRRREFAHLQGDVAVPDPQDPEVFERSRLDWTEYRKPGHVEIWNLYRTSLQLRHQEAAFRPTCRNGWQVAPIGGNGVAIHYSTTDREFVLVYHRKDVSEDRIPFTGDWKLLLSSEDTAFGGQGAPKLASGSLTFARPTSVVLTRP